MDSRDLAGYLERVHRRTLEAAEAIPPGLLDWRPRAGEFTAAEVVAHIAESRLMNARVIVGAAGRYDGHAVATGSSPGALVALLAETSRAAIQAVSGVGLDAKIVGVFGDRRRAWESALGGLIEHEVHHRSQLCGYLAEMGAEPPALFGLHVEDLPRG